MMIVLVDCDGVIADFTHAFLDRVRRIAGGDFHPSVVTEWKIEESPELKAFFAERPGLAEKIWKEVGTPGFCYEMRPTEGAIDGVKKMIDDGHDVHALTAPFWSSPTWMQERTEWLHKHFTIRAPKVIHAHAKHLVFGDVFIDDKPDHVKAWAERWCEVTHRERALLWGAPYNETERRFRRVTSWNDVHSVIERRMCPL